MEVFRQAVELSSGSRAWCLATVVGVSGSTPRHLGAKMLIAVDGDTVGTIGGGRVEKEVIEVGAHVARTGTARTVRHHLVRDLAMCCGGSMEFYLEPVLQSVDALARAIELFDRRGIGDLITTFDGSAKTLEQEDVDDRVRTVHRSGNSLVEPIRPKERAVLFGCGHVTRALGPVLGQVGFTVVVCDDGETGALDRAPPWAQIVVDSFELTDVERVLGPLGSGDYLLIMTRDHAVDQRILEQALPRGELAYLGMIGSVGKVGRFRRRLEAKGIATDENWQRLHAPIGLDIVAETPAEIAVSVAAELVAIKNGGRRE